MNAEPGGGTGGTARALVRVVVGGVLLGFIGSVAAWEAGRLPSRLEIEDPGRFVAALQGAPWLAALYGTRGAAAEKRGDLREALYEYGLLLQALPEHAGTRLARARLALQNAPLDGLAMAQALEDVEVAQQGYRRQLELLDGGRARAGWAPETEVELGEIRQLGAVLRNSRPR